MEEGSSKSDGTIGFILESKNRGYYALTSAHTLIKVEKDPQHKDYLQAFEHKVYYNHILCKVLGETFQVEMTEVVAVFDDDVDVALIPIPYREDLISKLNGKYKFRIEFNRLYLEEMKAMSVVKYGKSTGRTIGNLVEFGNSKDGLNNQYFISSDREFAKTGDSGSLCYLYQSNHEKLKIIPLGMLNEKDSGGKYLISPFDMITSSIWEKHQLGFENFICLSDFFDFGFVEVGF
jgi:hypothetical protein